MPDEQSNQGNQPFVGQEDRPEVKIQMDTPLSELTVRDLQSIVGGGIVKIKSDKELVKEKLEVIEGKQHIKIEKFEHKNEIKEFKFEKFEKIEKFEHKHEKFEIAEKLVPEQVVDPTQLGGPVEQGGLNQVIQQVGNLANQMERLSNQIEEIQKRMG